MTIAERFNRSDISYQIGGRALLFASGFDGEVDAIDLVFPAAARNELSKLLHELTGIPAVFGADEPPFTPAWRCVHHWGTETLDCIGGLAVEVGNSTVRLPYRPGRTWHLDGVEMPLAPAEQWMFVYRMLDPRSAARLLDVVDEEGHEALSHDLGLVDGATD
ncbi:hypothetical protein HQ535_09735 [bacterium]|nr:hypothetical protein [bacterium]